MITVSLLAEVNAGTTRDTDPVKLQHVSPTYYIGDLLLPEPILNDTLDSTKVSVLAKTCSKSITLKSAPPASEALRRRSGSIVAFLLS